MNDLSEKESMIIEFQTMFNDSVFETLVAFANTEGGTVYIGIDEDGTIHGISINEETLELWKNAIYLNTNPNLVTDCKILTIEDKFVVSLHVNESIFKPVSSMGRFLKRYGSSNVFMNAEEISNEYLKTNKIKTEKKTITKENAQSRNKPAKKGKRFIFNEKIIKLIKANKYITLMEIAIKLRISLKSVERYIKNLKSEGMVERIGADRGGYWKVLR